MKVPPEKIKDLEERLSKFSDWFRKQYGTDLIRVEKEIVKQYLIYSEVSKANE